MNPVMRDRIVFWQDVPSILQAAFVRALAEILPDGNTIAVFQRNLSARRRAMGWPLPDYGRARVLIAPSEALAEKLVRTSDDSSCHLFSGAPRNVSIRAALRVAFGTGALVGLLSDGRNWRGWKGVGRQVHSVRHERRYRQRVDFVLAMGHLGVRWYRKCGYEDSAIFPFCYAVERQNAMAPPRGVKDCAVRIVFVCQLVPRKGVDLLVQALAKLGSGDWVLDVIGDGSEKSPLEVLAEKLGLNDKVRFRGVVANREVRETLGRSDVLVLPSRWDGWGAVVNEALMSGVPVVCGSMCGAADLIRRDANGDVFESGSVDSLAAALGNWIARGPLTQSARDEIRRWSRCIEGPVLARYLVDVVNFVSDRTAQPRPRPRWLS